jgi:hypothetical protein
MILAQGENMPSEVMNLPGARMLRFLTPTAAWAARMGSAVTAPAEWPLMLVEIFVASDGAILMTSVLGVPKNCVKAFFAQGAYVYPFEELQEAIIEVLDQHFAQEEKDLRSALNSLAPSPKPKLILVKR